MFFARLAYEDPGNRRDILADSLQRAGAAAVMTVHNDNVVAQGHYPHRIHFFGRTLVNLDFRHNRDHFDTQVLRAASVEACVAVVLRLQPGRADAVPYCGVL